jgi:PAS domain S-box-containing protein
MDQKRRITEEALRKSEQKLKYHIENSPLAVIEWDKNYLVTQWSEAAEKIFGWKKEETIGKTIDKLNIIYEDDIAEVEKTMGRLSGGRELNVISSNRNYTRSKEIRECIWYNSVLPDEEGQMSSVMSVVEDVTEIRKFEKLLKESQEMLLSVLNATQESIYV